MDTLMLHSPLDFSLETDFDFGSESSEVDLPFKTNIKNDWNLGKWTRKMHMNKTGWNFIGCKGWIEQKEMH